MDPKKLTLENKWTLWFHSKNNRNWDKESYTKICEIYTVNDFWQIFNHIKNFTTEMYFLMKDDIFPMWECDDNKNGGAWTFDFDRNYGHDIWVNISLLLIGGTLSFDNYDDINGISIKPKYSSSIVKVWTKSINNSSCDDYFNIDELQNIFDEFDIQSKINESVSFSKY